MRASEQAHLRILLTPTSPPPSPTLLSYHGPPALPKAPEASFSQGLCTCHFPVWMAPRAFLPLISIKPKIKGSLSTLPSPFLPSPSLLSQLSLITSLHSRLLSYLWIS